MGGKRTFGDGVALVERVDGGGEGVEGSELDGLAEAFEVQDGGAHGFHALADLIDAVRVEEAVAGGRLEQQVQRHLAGGWRMAAAAAAAAGWDLGGGGGVRVLVGQGRRDWRGEQIYGLRLGSCGPSDNPFSFSPSSNFLFLHMCIS